MEHWITWEYHLKMWLWHRFGAWSIIAPLLPAVLFYGTAAVLALREKKRAKRKNS